MMEFQRGQRIRVKVPQWLAQERRLASRTLEGTIEALSERAVFLKGTVSVEPSSSCHRCGREITHPVSLLIGYGPDCCAHLGIPREGLERDQLDAIRAKLAKEQAGAWWFPKTSLREVELLGTVELAPLPPKAAPVVSLAVRAGRIAVNAPFALKDDLKAIEGARWDKDNKAWTFPESAWSMKALDALFVGMEVRCNGDIARLREQAQAATAAQAAKTAVDLDAFVTKTSPWLHQAQAYHFARQLPAAMLAMEMGTGKSKVAVDLVCNDEPGPVLIICPKSVVNVWPKQFRVHAGVDVVRLALSERARYGDSEPTKKLTVKEKTEHARKFVETAERPVVIINYQSACLEPFASWAKTVNWRWVILDESHKIKAPGGVQSMFCDQLGKHAARRLCLTGTPMPHGLEDSYAQYRFLDKGVFGTSFKRFKERYTCEDDWGRVYAYQNEAEFNSKFYSVAFRATKDVLDLPPVQHIERYCSLAPEAARAYKELSTELVTELEKGVVTASNALVKLLRLRQITSGYLPVEKGEPDVMIDTAKRELLADVLDDIDASEPVVVFCVFRHDLDTIKEVCAKNGRRYGELSGRTKDGLTADSTMREDIDVLGVQLQAGGVGIDLTRARYCVYYSNGFSLGDYDQSLSRVHRPGQTRNTYYIHLIAEGTVDQKVYKVLNDRADVIAAILKEGL